MDYNLLENLILHIFNAGQMAVIEHLRIKINDIGAEVLDDMARDFMKETNYPNIEAALLRI